MDRIIAQHSRLWPNHRWTRTRICVNQVITGSLSVSVWTEALAEPWFLPSFFWRVSLIVRTDGESKVGRSDVHHAGRSQSFRLPSGVDQLCLYWLPRRRLAAFIISPAAKRNINNGLFSMCRPGGFGNHGRHHRAGWRAAFVRSLSASLNQ